MFWAYTVSALGDVVFDTTVVIWIAAGIAPDKSWAPSAVSGVLLAAALPVLVVGPVAGVMVDRTDRRRILLISNVVQGGAVASLLVLTGLGSALSVGLKLGWIYTVVLVTNAAGQFFRQARLAMVAEVVPPPVRTRAFSATMSSLMILGIVGPPVAAPLYFALGIWWSLLLNSLSFFASCLLLLPVRWNSAPKLAERGTFWTDLRAGWRSIRQNRVLWAITWAITAVTLGAGVLNALEIFFITDVLHRSASFLGFMTAVFAVGSLLGARLAPAVEERLGAISVFVGSLLMTGLFLTLYASSSTLWMAAALWFLAAVPLGCVNTVVMPLAMNLVPENLLGRSLTLLNVLPTLASLLGIAAGGWLAGNLLSTLHFTFVGLSFGPIDTLFTAAGLAFIVTAVFAFRATRSRIQTP